MEWWQQLLVSVASGVVTAAAAVFAVLAEGRRHIRLAEEHRRQDRQDKIDELRRAAYSAFLTWLSEVPTTLLRASDDPTKSIESGIAARRAIAQLLLYASPAVRQKAFAVQEQLQSSGLRALADIAKLAKQVRDGELEHLNQQEVETLVAIEHGKHFYADVWPIIVELADAMAAEISGRG